MKCDKLKAYGMADPAIDEEYEMYKVAEVDEAIAELKDGRELDAMTIAELKAVNESLKAKLESVQASAYAEMVDAGMRERRLKRALWLARANSAEGQFFYWCARFGVESGFTKADIRGYSVNTKRTLRTIGEWIEMWKNVERKCRAKAELYK